MCSQDLSWIPSREVGQWNVTVLPSLSIHGVPIGFREHVSLDHDGIASESLFHSIETNGLSLHITVL
jgi:hypothetical protein